MAVPSTTQDVLAALQASAEAAAKVRQAAKDAAQAVAAERQTQAQQAGRKP